MIGLPYLEEQKDKINYARCAKDYPRLSQRFWTAAAGNCDTLTEKYGTRAEKQTIQAYRQCFDSKSTFGTGVCDSILENSAQVASQGLGSSASATVQPGHDVQSAPPSVRSSEVWLSEAIPNGTLVQGQKAFEVFDRHSVPVYVKEFKLPDWITRDQDGTWRDKLGKAVPAPQVNFAGRYFVVEHSCGGGCAYFTMNDLTTGENLKELDAFGRGENNPKTSDGFEYRAEIFGRSNSSALLVYQFVDKGGADPECRVAAFKLESKTLTRISEPTIGCARR
jgi:hypothetical protein